MTLTACGGSSSSDTDADTDKGVVAPADESPSADETPTAGDDGLPADTSGGIFPPDASDIGPTPAVHARDGYDVIDVLRVDLRTVTTEGICLEGDQSGCTLADVLADTDHKDDFKVDIDVHFSADDFADDGTISNAELRQRGGTTRKAPQKSFRVRLDDADRLWRNERHLLLNKHPFEATRIRNKLAFDLMSEIPHLLASRTQFVNLWLDDGDGASDYGLFTHVEAPKKRFLEKRGLSEDDRLYKAEFFRFSDDDLFNVAVDADGSPIDEDRFEISLDIENGDDHRPLVQMLTDLHDPDIPFQTTFERYFNANNVLTWTVVNQLLFQSDAVTHNYLLYNPDGTEKFYFLPWDYDGTFVTDTEPPAGFSNDALQRRLFYGYARAGNNDFIDRYFRQPGMHQRFIDAAAYLRENYLTDETISSLAMQYESVVEPFVTQLPDSEFNPGFLAGSTGSFARAVAANETALSTRYGMPIPPDVLDPELDGSDWLIQWQPAFDLTGDTLSYELQISRTIQFRAADLVVRRTDIADAAGLITERVPANLLGPRDYFVRVIARPSAEPERYFQVNRNFENQGGQTFYGVLRFNAADD